MYIYVYTEELKNAWARDKNDNGHSCPIRNQMCEQVCLGEEKNHT